MKINFQSVSIESLKSFFLQLENIQPYNYSHRSYSIPVSDPSRGGLVPPLWTGTGNRLPLLLCDPGEYRQVDPTMGFPGIE